MDRSSGHTTLEIRHRDTEEVAEVDVWFETWYDHGVWYHADGSGTPPDWGWEITSWEMSSGENAPKWLNEDLVEAALEAAFERGDID